MPATTVIRKSQPLMSQLEEIETDYLFVRAFFLSCSSWDLVPRMSVLDLDNVRSLRSGHP